MSHLNATPAVFTFARYFTRPLCPQCSHEQFVPERSKIMPRRISGVCTPHQRLLSDAIKKARNIALLPFATE